MLSRATLRRLSVILIGCSFLLFVLWPWLPIHGSRPPRTITVFGFSIMNDALVKSVFPAFQKLWLEKTGEHVEFISSFAGSGTVVNQIVLGVPVQVAILSHELDALRLVEKRVIAGETWRELPHEGIVNRSPMVIVTRAGNPHAIKSFGDLSRPGLHIVHPDPMISGAAKWLILAEYGSLLTETGDSESAVVELAAIWKNVTILSSSARAASTQFKAGFGDALVTYEQEVLADRLHGKDWGHMVYPPSTIFSEHPVVLIPKNIQPADREMIASFVRFLWSLPAQDAFTHYGFRSATPASNGSTGADHEIAHPLSVSTLGGWRRADTEIIKGIWEDRVLPLSARNPSRSK